MSTQLPLEGVPCDDDIARWIDGLAERRSRDEIARLREAVAVARRVHVGQQFVDGTDMLLGLLHTADILDRLKLDTYTLIAGLLSEWQGESGYEPAEVRERFGESVQHMVEQVGRIRELSVASAHHDPENVEKLCRLLLDLAGDVRSLLVLLAKRLRLMRGLKRLDPELQRLIALETRWVHAPLANRLGVWRIKWELEDLCLRYLEPAEYKDLAARLEGKRSEREAFIRDVVERIERLCHEQDIDAEVMGRPKHIYSIWNKMRQKHLNFEQVMDVRAVRVLVETVSQCYEVLGMAHGEWRPIPGEFDDYIAHPKPNGYQSLHTAVVGDDGRPLEVQVRTRQMHELAERGVAAHWRYKENDRADSELERRIAWMRAWLERQNGNDAGGLPEDEEYEARRIYVLTPNGKVIELPRGATPVDFSYAIHTDVGHRCRGAKVNGRMVPLNRSMESGDRVEIITAREGGPSRDWLDPRSGYVVTVRARSRIRQWFKQQDREQHLSMGRQALEREFQRLGLPLPDLEKLARRFYFHKADELLAAVGRGDLSVIQAANSQVVDRPEEVCLVPEEAIIERAHVQRLAVGVASGTVVVQGVGDLMAHMAGCCKPVPPAPIVGYVTRGRGITIHRQDCRVIQKMDEENRRRLLPAVWSEGQQGSQFIADIHLYAGDRKGLLRDITSVFANADIRVLGVNSQSDRREETASMRVTVEVDDMAQLARVMGQLAQIPDVLEVHRQT